MMLNMCIANLKTYYIKECVPPADVNHTFSPSVMYRCTNKIWDIALCCIKCMHMQHALPPHIPASSIKSNPTCYDAEVDGEGSCNNTAVPGNCLLAVIPHSCLKKRLAYMWWQGSSPPQQHILTATFHCTAQLPFQKGTWGEQKARSLACVIINQCLPLGFTVMLAISLLLHINH